MDVEKLNEVVLITGASSGIGEACALQFARQGFRVVLAARRTERIETLAEKIRSEGGSALPVTADLSQLDSIHQLVRTTLAEWGQIDILFNNAGFGRLMFLEALDPVKDIEAQFKVNLEGLVHLTRATLPQMIARRRGHIINMASIAGLVAMPTYSIYAATKFAVRGFTDALRREVGIWGIKVSGIYPGSVETEFGEHTGADRISGVRMPKILVLSTEDVAREVVRLTRHPRRMVVVPRIMRPAVWLAWHFPGIVDWGVERFFVRRERFVG